MRRAAGGLLAVAASAGAATAQEPAPPPGAWPEVFERLDVYGDLRLRHESTFDQQPGGDDRHRERLRFRLGAEYAVLDELALGARVVTGDPDDPNTTHATLGDGFDGLELSLDRLYVDWRPAWWEGAWARGGKFQNPLVRSPVYGELVWDGDVQLEGAALGRTVEACGPFARVDVVTAGLTAFEQGGGDDAWAFLAQAAGRVDLGERLSAEAALGYWHWGDTAPDGARALVADDAGNAVSDLDGDGAADAFVSDFGIVNPLVVLAHEGAAVPLALSLESFHNVRAEIDADRGWAVGLAVGRARERGDWRAYWQWAVVQQDAVFSPVAGDDLFLQTNHRSHVAGVEHRLTDAVGLRLWALVSTPDRPVRGLEEDEIWRVRLDLDVRL